MHSYAVNGLIDPTESITPYVRKQSQRDERRSWPCRLRNLDDLESVVRKGCSKANTTCVALPGILVSAGVIFALCSILLLLHSLINITTGMTEYMNFSNRRHHKNKNKNQNQRSWIMMEIDKYPISHIHELACISYGIIFIRRPFGCGLERSGSGSAPCLFIQSFSFKCQGQGPRVK